MIKKSGKEDEYLTKFDPKYITLGKRSFFNDLSGTVKDTYAQQKKNQLEIMRFGKK